MQGMEWMNNRAAFSDGDVAGEYAMILAFSDLAHMTQLPTLPHASANRDGDVAMMMSL